MIGSELPREPRPEQAIFCPECGEELGVQDDIFVAGDGDMVMGCSQCLHAYNAVAWLTGEGATGAETYSDYW